MLIGLVIHLPDVYTIFFIFLKMLEVCQGKFAMYVLDFRVQIINFHFANSKMNSSYCKYKVVNYIKRFEAVFPQ